MRIFGRGGLATGPGAAEKNHQTIRLEPGRHGSPGASVCVMELASMLAGERFTDHPKSVCPTISALLRTYNDALGPEERQDLYRYASAVVGTRADYALQDRRAQFALAWARSRQYGRRQRRKLFARKRATAQRDGSPVDIAEYVVESLGRRPTRGSHAAMLRLLDWIIEMRPPGEPVEHEARVGPPVGAAAVRRRPRVARGKALGQTQLASP